MNQVVMMEQLIEALKKQIADLEAQKSTMERERLSFYLLHRYTQAAQRQRKRAEGASPDPVG